jgi:hypothetical protein
MRDRLRHGREPIEGATVRVLDADNVRDAESVEL